MGANARHAALALHVEAEAASVAVEAAGGFEAVAGATYAMAQAQDILLAPDMGASDYTREPAMTFEAEPVDTAGAVDANGTSETAVPLGQQVFDPEHSQPVGPWADIDEFLAQQHGMGVNSHSHFDSPFDSSFEF